MRLFSERASMGIGARCRVEQKPIASQAEYDAYAAQAFVRGSKYKKHLTGRQIKMIAMMSRNLSLSKEIGEAVGWSPDGVRKFYKRLPEHLK